MMRYRLSAHRTHKEVGADCTHINLLSAFIQQMCLLPTRMGISKRGGGGGVKFRELVMRSKNLIGNECKAHRKKKLSWYLVSCYRLNEFACAY